jgi:hypothetical protein
MRSCPTTRAYVARRTAEGKNPREIRRCLKRYIARQLYRTLATAMTPATDILTQCAWAAAHTHDTYLSAQFWRLARRIGKKKAAVAVAHSILVICWHLLTHDRDYDDLGGDYFTRRNTDRQRDRLLKQLHSLGYYATLEKIA